MSACTICYGARSIHARSPLTHAVEAIVPCPYCDPRQHAESVVRACMMDTAQDHPDYADILARAADPAPILLDTRAADLQEVADHETPGSHSSHFLAPTPGERHFADLIGG